MTTTIYTSGIHSGTVTSGNEVYLLNGAVGADYDVASGGVLYPLDGGSTSNTQIYGLEDIGSRAFDSGSVLGSGGVEEVAIGSEGRDRSRGEMEGEFVEEASRENVRDPVVFAGDVMYSEVDVRVQEAFDGPTQERVVKRGTREGAEDLDSVQRVREDD